MNKRKLAILCMMASISVIHAEKITIAPNWAKGETKQYYAEEYTDTTKTNSVDMTIEVLDKNDGYKMSCTYSNHQDFTGMMEVAKTLIGEEILNKIEKFVPQYTVTKEGVIASADNFKEYQEIFSAPQDTASDNFFGMMKGMMSTIMKSMVAADEKGFMELNLKEVLAMHKFFGATYDTETENHGKLNVSVQTINFGDADAIIKVSKSDNRINITATSKLSTKECAEALTAWMNKYTESIAQECEMPLDSKEISKKTKEAVKEFKKAKISAEVEETATYDAGTGWLLNFKSVQKFKSVDGEKSETLIVTAR